MNTESETQAGYCQCGCGTFIGFWEATDRSTGKVKGQPKRFSNGHQNRLYKRPAESRFWEKVSRGPGCWLWEGADRGDGYGAFFADGKHLSAHRYSFELANGPIPEGMVICHSCDNPPCVNPAHLFSGTHADNVNDKVAKGRTPARSGHSQAKLSEDDIENIRVLSPGLSQRQIAKLFGVGQTQIGRICRGEAWA